MPPHASDELCSVGSCDGSLEGNEDYRKFVDKLSECGVDKYVDLPMIAVMGDTSSGT